MLAYLNVNIDFYMYLDKYIRNCIQEICIAFWKWLMHTWCEIS
jgi:hypothetical protein